MSVSNDWQVSAGATEDTKRCMQQDEAGGSVGRLVDHTLTLTHSERLARHVHRLYACFFLTSTGSFSCSLYRVTTSDKEHDTLLTIMYASIKTSSHGHCWCKAVFLLNICVVHEAGISQSSSVEMKLFNDIAITCSINDSQHGRHEWVLDHWFQCSSCHPMQ